MSEQGKFGEPWTVTGRDFTLYDDADGNEVEDRIAFFDTQDEDATMIDMGDYRTTREHVAERIVASVNACATINPAKLGALLEACAPLVDIATKLARHHDRGEAIVSDHDLFALDAAYRAVVEGAES